MKKKEEKALIHQSMTSYCSGFNEPSVVKSLKNGMRHYQRNNGNNQ